MRSIVVLVTFAAIASGVVGMASPPAPATGCDVSVPVSDRPPDDASASTFASPGGTWYANTERTLWAWW